jgi:hypothetical protein
MQQVAGVGEPDFVDEQHTMADHQAIEETSFRKDDRRCLQPNARKKASHAGGKRVGITRIGKNGNGTDCHKLALEHFITEARNNLPLIYADTR